MARKAKKTDEINESFEEKHLKIVAKLQELRSKEVPCDSHDKKQFSIKMRGRVEGLDEAIREVSVMKL
ncbi:MAG: hypothetical protein DRJ03_02660 [Chloroflexi bacterium]|nr:MAG: hypothetical protein DRJ03_02660 [Chloroflexota bacterium]